MKKQILRKCSSSETVALRKCSSSEKVANMREEASSFEKKIDYVYVILSYCLDICFLSQYFFLGNCFAKSAFNSTNLLRGLSQGLQLKGSCLDSPLGFSVIESFQGSWVLGMPHCVSKYIV